MVKYNYFGFPVLERGVKTTKAKTIDSSVYRLSRSQSGLLNARSVDTFNVTAGGVKAFETRSIKNLSILFMPPTGSRTFFHHFRVRIKVWTTAGSSIISRTPINFYPSLVILAPGASISTTEADVTYSLEDAIRSSISGEHQVISIPGFQVNRETTTWTGSSLIYQLSETVDIDITAAVNEFFSKSQNNPNKVDSVIHFVGTVNTPEGDGRDIFVLTDLESESSLKPIKASM